MILSLGWPQSLALSLPEIRQFKQAEALSLVVTLVIYQSAALDIERKKNILLHLVFREKKNHRYSEFWLERTQHKRFILVTSEDTATQWLYRVSQAIASYIKSIKKNNYIHINYWSIRNKDLVEGHCPKVIV